MAVTVGIGPQTKCEACGTVVAHAWEPDPDPRYHWWTEWPDRDEGRGYEFIEHTPERCAGIRANRLRTLATLSRLSRRSGT